MSDKSKTRYQQMREKGLCFDCRKPLDRDGIVCTSCKNKRNEYERGYYKMYIDRGICPRCRKNKILGDESNCVECRADHAERMIVARSRNRERYNSYTRDYNKRRRAECKENGICTKCMTRKATEGYLSCAKCRIKSRESKRTQYYKEKQEGICRFCSNPVANGYRVCEKHRQILAERSMNENTIKAREKYKKTNEIFFKGKERMA